MRKRRVLLMPPDATPPCAGVLMLLASLLVGGALGACPPLCSCSSSHRQVDCSSRGLSSLPLGLQHNLHSLNLSHNNLASLDHQLSSYTHLRLLDLSHNRLVWLPSALPRGLWELHAAHNAIRLLDKNATAYQWNLRVLDLSRNQLERAVFINNTLTSLRSLNLSHNRFWTLPTNLPAGLVTVDLSHNSLLQVLPGSLDRLPRLEHLDLHANRFSGLGRGVFARLAALQLLSLGENPWACWEHASISPLLSWLQHTPARVLGCPCSARPVCGQGARAPRAGGWHYASYTLPPLAASEPSGGQSWPPPHARPTGWWYLSEPIHHTLRAPSSFTPHPHHLTSTPPSSFTPPPPPPPSLLSHTSPAESPLPRDTPSPTDLLLLTHKPLTTDPSVPPDLPPPPLTPASTRRTPTLRTRSVRRPNQTLPSGVRSQAPGPLPCCPLQGPLPLGLLALALLH
ncbi:oligodendrocyte-myelin glycoprotein-like [Osmerus eperlanus]|uniref:oligodendrocyte-myelin glycoprotein-like n=1 Tax=Osmerus eperlanus TaxID=29151 RepID=UPI002E0D4773